MKLITTLIAGILLVSLAACSSPAPKQTQAAPTVVENAPAQSGYPAPGSDNVQGKSYPAPEVSKGSYPTPTISANLGQVEGTLLQNGKPLVDKNVYISPVIKSQEGIKLVVKFNRLSPLNTSTDEAGHFLVPNIPPGDYGLVLDYVADALLLSDPKTGDQIVFEVKGNETIKLGEMNFSDLPLP